MTETKSNLNEIGKNAMSAIREMVDALRAEVGDCKDEDDARQRIQEDPLSIEYRSGWVTDKDEMKAAEVCILLAYGGPAVRIMVEINGEGEPTKAKLQVQDWGTPWADYHEDATDEILMAYVGVFYFGD